MWGDQSVLDPDRGGGSRTSRMYSMPPHHALPGSSACCGRLYLHFTTASNCNKKSKNMTASLLCVFAGRCLPTPHGELLAPGPGTLSHFRPFVWVSLSLRSPVPAAHASGPWSLPVISSQASPGSGAAGGAATSAYYAPRLHLSRCDPGSQRWLGRGLQGLLLFPFPPCPRPLVFLA